MTAHNGVERRPTSDGRWNLRYIGLMLITTLGLHGQQNERWQFVLHLDAREVVIPTTGHPLDGPPVFDAQAEWVDHFAPSLVARAPGAWHCGPRVFNRLLAVLQAHSVDL